MDAAAVQTRCSSFVTAFVVCSSLVTGQSSLHLGGFRGSIFNDGQVTQEAEVCNPAQESLPDLRPASRLPGEVQDVPVVFPATGAQGRDPGSGEVELVIGIRRVSFGAKRRIPVVPKPPTAEILRRAQNDSGGTEK